MTCPHCHHVNPADARFCTGCGQALQGDTTNLAARLQQMAPAGAIWVGETTYRIAREAFEWQEVGAQAVKGKADAVPVYALRGPRLGRSRFEVVAQRGLTRFVGRYPELQQLLAAWGQTEQGAGRVVSVVGEAGIGKSRLLYEFKQWLAQEDASYVESSCFAYGDSISYLPFLEIVRGFCGLEGREAEADAKRQIAQRLMALPLNPTTVASYVHNLLAFSVDDAHFARLTPELIRQRTVETLTTLVLAVARQQPLVVILEDVHWIDKASEEVLTALVEAMVTVPVLLVLVYRPEYLHAWVNRTYHAYITLTRLPGASSAAMVRALLTKPYAAQVPLERLTPEQRQAMVQDLLGTATLSPELERLIVAKTDGNPLFVEELTLSLLESGDLLTRYEAMAVRVGDRGLLGAFYNGLGWGEYGFGHFNHAIQILTKAAELCEAAGNPEDAGQAYMLLQWSYMWKGAYDQVLTLNEDALRLLAQRFNLRWYLFVVTAASLAYTALGHWGHAVEDAHKALRAGEEFSDHSVISFAAWVLSWAYTARGDLMQALEYAELGIQNALTPADKNWVQSLLGWAWGRAGEPRKGVELLAEALAINRSGHPADKVGVQSAHVPAEIFQMLFLGEAYWLAGESDNARQTLEELLELANRCGAQFYLGSAHRLLGEIALSTDPVQVAAPLAASHFEQSIAILQQIHAENELALAYTGYGRLHQRQGHAEQAHDYLTRALTIFERLGTLGEPDKLRQALAALPRA